MKITEELAEKLLEALSPSRYIGSVNAFKKAGKERWREKGLLEEEDYLAQAGSMGCSCIGDFRIKIELLYKAIKQLQEIK